MTKGKGVAVERDRGKVPTPEELYDHLMNGMGWQATRFADLELLKALEIDSDMAELLGHLKMPSFSPWLIPPTRSSLPSSCPLWKSPTTTLDMYGRDGGKSSSRSMEGSTT
ncbi:Uncharacterized protein Rs2_06022 [Raphanus sativus]|nr:Uncharacterized protein Rs2_06022 [Raphanus sativus]